MDCPICHKELYKRESSSQFECSNINCPVSIVEISILMIKYMDERVNK